MPIVPLPETTINQLGSSQCLTDPASVVKELVDNSLDANATAIAIEISANTLDLIKVKDNGHGIISGDRGLLCKRHCTSKIRTLDDLQKVGGDSLGFRGEALASAVELSNQVTIATRVEGEVAAIQVMFDSHGNRSRWVSTPLLQLRWF